MQPELVLAGVVFLSAIFLTGSFALLIPISKQLAKYLEFRMKEKAPIAPELQAELRELRSLVESLDDKVKTVADRQEFVERMLEAPK